MPTNVVMLVRCTVAVPDLREFQTRFLTEMGLTMDDFYVEGPLTRVTNRNYEAIPSDDNESDWLSVNLWKSYYGRGYERGDIQLFVKVAEWLEQNLPNCQLYYGNDATPDQVRLFDKEYRQDLLNYH